VTKCPMSRAVRKLFDEELSEAERAELAQHMRGCELCQQEYRELRMFHEALEEAVSGELCPDSAELETYLAGSLSDERKKKINEHLKLCRRCQMEVAFIREPAAEEEWSRKEEEVFRTSQIERIAEVVAEKTGRALLGEKSALKEIWSRVCGLYEHLRRKDPSQWPKLVQPAALAGTMGFAGPLPAETVATVIMGLTALAVAQRAIEGMVGEIAGETEVLARTLGAGPKLRDQLRATMPAILKEVLDQERS